MKGRGVALVVSLLAAGGCVNSGSANLATDPGSGPVAAEDMPTYCTRKASAAFGADPKDIALAPVDTSGGIYTLHGRYPPEGGGAQTFQCQFDPDGMFISVFSTSKSG